MKTSVMYLALFMLACAGNARPRSFVDTSIQHDGTTPLASVIPSISSGGEEGADALGDAFHQVAQGLLQGAERRSQEALQKAEDRLNDLQKQITPSKRRDADAGLKVLIDELEHRMQKLEASIERALERALPRVATLIAPLERNSFPVETSGIRLTSTAPSTSLTLPTSTSPSTVSPTASPSTRPRPPTVSAPEVTATRGAEAKHTQWGKAEAEDEEREKHRVKLRIQRFKAKLDRGFRDYLSLEETLRNAIESDTYKNVRHLLDSGAEVNYTTRDGQDMLQLAIQRTEKNADIVKLLVERGAHINTVDLHGKSPLHLAARYDLSGKIVTLLIGAGAVVDARDGGGATPLHRAAHFYNLAGVRALLAAGANKSLRGWDGWCKNKTAFDVTKADNIRDLLHP